MPNHDVIEQQMEDMKGEMREMRASMGKIADAMIKLAVLEEKNHVFAMALEKIVDKVDLVEQRQRDEIALRDTIIAAQRRIEQVEGQAIAVAAEQARLATTISVVSKTIKVVWAVLGAALLYAAGQLIHLITGRVP